MDINKEMNELHEDFDALKECVVTQKKELKGWGDYDTRDKVRTCKMCEDCVHNVVCRHMAEALAVEIDKETKQAIMATHASIFVLSAICLEYKKALPNNSMFNPGRSIN